MVRLKEMLKNLLTFTQKAFQFLMVRLKAAGVSTDGSWVCTFQFLMVRLKDRYYRA